jgi:peptidoglycan/LPS O-acetylase OafA/YrhL
VALLLDQGNATQERRLSYQPALDGIRALAVAAVLAYHAGFSWARGGFLGVDAFFVLSGFLITSLLLVEYRAKGRIAFTAFWARRGRRLLPALFLMLIGVGVYAVVFAKPDELDRLRADALTTIGYVANWRPVFAGESYFEQFSVPSPLRHTWSLAIEEQWYAFWPLLLFGVLRLRGGSLRSTLTMALAMAAASALLMALLFQPLHDPSRVYYGTDTRAQSLLVGATLAMLSLQFGPVRGAAARWTLQGVAVVCVVFVGFVWARADDNSSLLYRGGFIVLATSVAVVIAASVQPGFSVVGRVLSLPPLRALGLISYGVYLWHWPVYLVLTPDRIPLDDYPLFALRVAATLAISIASYRLLEMPVRRGAFRQWRVSWTLAPATAACVAVALVVVTRGGAPTFSVPSASSSGPPPTAAPAATKVSGTSSEPVRVLIVGDSVAVTLSDGLERAQEEWNIAIWDRSVLGCGLVGADAKFFQGKWIDQGTECGEWRDRWRSDVDSFRPDVVLLLSGAWDTYDMNVDGRSLEFGTPETDEYVLAGLERAVDVVTSEGARVALLTTPYPEKRERALDGRTNRVDSARIDGLNQLLRKIAEERPDEVEIIDLGGHLDSLGNPDEIDGVDLRLDDLHFTPAGSDIIARWLAPQLLQVAGEGSTP